jgi:hypothetical protein
VLRYVRVKMERLQIRGATLLTPSGTNDDIKLVLRRLGVDSAFDEVAIDEIYFRLSKIIGRWFEEQSAKNASPVAKALLRTGKQLIAAAELLGGHETGFQSHVKIESTSSVKSLLALAPTVGSMDKAEQMLRAFRESAHVIALASMAASLDLRAENSKGGRETL